MDLLTWKRIKLATAGVYADDLSWPYQANIFGGVHFPCVSEGFLFVFNEAHYYWLMPP